MDERRWSAMMAVPLGEEAVIHHRHPRVRGYYSNHGSSGDGGTSTELSNVIGASLHVIVSCTDRKTMTVPEALQLRHYRSNDPVGMHRRWVTALDAHTADPLEVRDLYSGDHWKQVRELVAGVRRAGRQAQLWVLSAGYGVLHETDTIHPYSATFAPNQSDVDMPVVLDKGDQAIRDSVVPEDSFDDRRAALRRWWRYLTDRGEMTPRRMVGSLRELLGDARARESNVLVVASPWYLDAVADDLGRGVDALARPVEQVSIVSLGGRRLANDRKCREPLDRFLLDFDTRVSRVVGGAQNALNARVARALVERIGDRPCSRQNMERELAQMMRGLDPLEVVQRIPMTDEEVLGWIRQQIIHRVLPGFEATAGGAYPAKSELLRDLRAEGKACEQKRFGRLYTTVLAEGAR